jgi:peptidoglycan/xylan/chitin deacetylase (PgdA/CDA1 family)
VDSTTTDPGAPYEHSPIVARPPLHWPGGARVAFYLGLNVEAFSVDRPGTSISAVTRGLVPDPMNYGWRDYGVRVGIWRMIELLDRLGIVPSVVIDSVACHRYPEIVQAGRERDWAWVAHGRFNADVMNAFDDPAAERAYLAEMVAELDAALPSRPRGWLGPALTESFATPALLRELGFTYLLDWCCDDQPFPLTVPGMISVPYAVELNDILLFLGRSLSGEDFVTMVLDQLEQLLADASEGRGRVMALAVHPFIVGQPFRHKYLERLLERIASTDGVWLTTSDAIAHQYLQGANPA